MPMNTRCANIASSSAMPEETTEWTKRVLVSGDAANAIQVAEPV